MLTLLKTEIKKIKVFKNDKVHTINKTEIKMKTENIENKY